MAGWDRVEGEIETKGRRVRRVPIASPLREVLARRAVAVGAARDPVSAGVRVNGRVRRSPRASCSAGPTRRGPTAGLRRITLHECRHTFASYMIAAGVNAKALSEYMGHASVRFTFDLYGHLMPGNETEAATLLDGYLAAGTGG